MSASRPSTVSTGLPVCRYESPTILEAESSQDSPVLTGLASAAVLKIFSSSSLLRAPPRACKKVVSHGCIAVENLLLESNLYLCDPIAEPAPHFLNCKVVIRADHHPFPTPFPGNNSILSC